MAEEGVLSQIKRFLVGEPIPSHLAHHERLSRTTGLAVLSSDPLSSVAYATEEILRVLILVGVSALSFASPIAFVIATILAIVVFRTGRRSTRTRMEPAPTLWRKTISVKCRVLLLRQRCSSIMC